MATKFQLAAKVHFMKLKICIMYKLHVCMCSSLHVCVCVLSIACRSHIFGFVLSQCIRKQISKIYICTSTYVHNKCICCLCSLLALVAYLPFSTMQDALSMSLQCSVVSAASLCVCFCLCAVKVRNNKFI